MQYMPSSTQLQYFNPKNHKQYHQPPPPLFYSMFWLCLICLFLFLFLLFLRLSKQMQGQTGEDLSKLDLTELLQHDLELQELLDVTQVLTKIKINMKTWICYLRKNPIIAHKFINIGIKCPMHQSNNAQMKTRTHVAAQILTSDHETLADFFIQPTQLSNSDEIEEEIETEESHNIGPVPIEQQYVFLTSTIEYIKEEEPDENCLNYMAKALQTLVRKKISLFLEFFLQQPQYFSRLTELSHFPSISHLLAKMLTDDDDTLTENALKVKRMIVPALLDKLHSDIYKPRTLQLIEGLEDILNSSRYSDNQQPTELQQATTPLVSEKETQFMMDIIFQGLEAQNKTEQQLQGIINASTYLGLCLARMAMDEQQELLFGSTGHQEFKPTLQYHLDPLFLDFCKWVSHLDRIWQFKALAGHQFPLLPVKIFEPLTLITKHSRFVPLYRKIPLDQRCHALQALLKLTCSTDISGILLQQATSLIQKMLTQEQTLAEEGLEIIPPTQLYISIEKYSGAIAASIALVLEQSRLQRNKNQKGIYFRKSLLLLDNYFKHPKVLEKYPHTTKIEELFPQFNHRNCQLYAEKAVVLDHPGGNKVQQVEEFKFIARNLHLIRTQAPESEGPDRIAKEVQEAKGKEGKVQDEKRQWEDEKPKEIIFKLDSKLNARKNKVKQQNTDKDSANPKVWEEPSTSTPKKEKDNSKQRAVQAKEESPRVQSPGKGRQQSGLNFFVRHLMIY